MRPLFFFRVPSWRFMVDQTSINKKGRSFRAAIGESFGEGAKKCSSTWMRDYSVLSSLEEQAD